MCLRKVLLVLFISFIVGGSIAQTIDNRFELIVSEDGSGDFKTIQEAINQVRDHAHKRVVIYIKARVYNEKVVIPSFKRNITLKGERAAQTIIAFGDYYGRHIRRIDVTGNH